MSEGTLLHALDKSVHGLQEWRKQMVEQEIPAIHQTTDLKIENAVSKAVNRILLGAAGLLALQTFIERVIVPQFRSGVSGL